MLDLTNVKINSLDLDRLYLSWETESNEDPQDYDFWVERSGSPSGPWDTITARALVDTYLFVDIEPGLLHIWAHRYYRIRVVRRDTQETAYYPTVPVRLQAEPPLDALEMARQELVLLKEFTGRLCWLFKRRTQGFRCPECWDPRASQRMKSRCLSCYDTSFAGGYHNPIECYIQIDPTASAPQLTGAIGEQQQQNTTARTIFFPPIDPRDVLVEAENIRWKVQVRTYTERVRSPVKQEMQLHRIPRPDIEYLLPLDLDVLNMDPTAVRQFSNPTTPSKVGAGLEGLFSSLGVS